MVPVAQLRVFTPLEAFPPRERERWAAYVEAGRGLNRHELADAEAGATAARLLKGRAGPGRDGPLGEDAALVRRAGDRTLLCPLQLDLRAAMAMASFRRTVPVGLIDAFVPDQRALARLEDLSTSGRVPHILDEPWAVPLHWFVCFAPEERRYVDPPEGAGPRLGYLTTCDQAADRLERAIELVEATVEDGEDVLAALAGVAAWLDAFDPASLLELDYGAVARLLSREELQADRTCAELWQALDALGAGDLLGAAAYYGVARSRWTHRRAKQHAS
ncbi:hypothetical protein [Egicoccus sp. AB-alg6-2]|uniref:hypothetical protein n=1 Tax=Egicoccus sp. AB-alg6-2 TaxID=3242692 RepID=UPI00359E1333